MKSKFVASTVVASALVVAVLAFSGIAHGFSLGVVETRVNANFMRVRVGATWQDVPLMPLAEHACQSGDSTFQRYCD